MSLRPFFAKLLAPSALFIFFSLASAGYSGCSSGDAKLTCDANGQNCFLCDAYGCKPATPNVGQGGSGGGGGGSSVGGGGAGGEAPCDPNVTTCGCTANIDCPTDTLCIEGLCIVGCNNSLECGPGKVCVNGKCEIGCSDQKPCDSGYVCDKGFCIPDPKNPQCTVQTPCPSGEACVDGICQPSCTTNADCPAGEICNATSGGCIPDPSPTPTCGPDKLCPGAAQCGVDGYCHYACANLTECKLIDSRFFACDKNICKTEEEVNPECNIDKPCPAGKDCVSNKCL